MFRRIRKFFYLLIILSILVLILYKYPVIDWIYGISNTKHLGSEEVFIRQVRAAMLDGEKELTLQYIGDVGNMEWFTNEVINSAFEIDDIHTADDFDYLRYKTESINSHIKSIGNYYTVSYEFGYNESKEETDKVNKKINDLFYEWKIETYSDYDKIKMIHDYIVNNTTYDTDLINYSAYDNLINKTSTCQGYITLAYKMFTLAGIPCRIISGTADGENHGWNIVKLNNKWYNIDLTWDDPITVNGEEILVYDYFLKSEKDFNTHIRDQDYLSKDFEEQYKISETSFE